MSTTKRHKSKVTRSSAAAAGKSSSGQLISRKKPGRFSLDGPPRAGYRPSFRKETNQEINSRRIYHEKNVPAPQSEKETYPRLSRALSHQERPRCSQASSRQGSQTSERLTWPKQRHLLKSAEFTDCYNGKKYFSRLFVLFVKSRSKGPSGPRLGLTVSKKSGNAVARNRIKRVVREFFRLHQSEFTGSCDVVVVPKRNLDPAQLDLELATAELLPVMQRADKDLLSGS